MLNQSNQIWNFWFFAMLPTKRQYFLRLELGFQKELPLIFFWTSYVSKLTWPTLLCNTHTKSWWLVVYLLLFLISDSPQVSLRLGRTLDADNIRTGHDVYFECDVKANPSPLRLEWLHNVNTEKILPILLFNHSGLKSLEKRAKIMLFAHQTKG